MLAPHEPSERGTLDPAVYFGLPVWLCAAIVFPLQVGITGASWLLLPVYLVAAGALLSLADAFYDPDLYRDWNVALFECLLRILGLAVPGALAFAFGLLVAPAEPGFAYDDCAFTGGSAASGTFDEELAEARQMVERHCLAYGSGRAGR